MKWIIDKSFSFCYGHRVHNQRLDTNFTESGDACLACRHLHGHEGLIKVFLEEDLDNTDENKRSNIESTGMVTDFKHLGWFKNFIDDVLDHKFIMDIEDPLFESEFPICSQKADTKFNSMRGFREDYFTADLDYVNLWLDDQDDLSDEEKSAIFEKYEGAIFVDFVPTSENLSAWLLGVVQDKMKDFSGVKVKAVEYWETPKSHCRVEA